MVNPMVDANIAIINELKSFSKEINEDPVKRQEYTFKESDFSRQRILTLERIVGILINMPKRTLSTEIREFFQNISVDDMATKAAFSQQRSKLKPSFFQAWNQLLVELFYKHYGTNVKRWRDFIIQAVDGSSAYLLNKKEVIDYFGTQENQHSGTPMARLMQIYDVLNNLIVWADISPIKTSEPSIMNKQVSSLSEDSITLFDRGYASFALIYLLKHQAKERFFVMRCKNTFNEQVKNFIKSSKRNAIVEFPATDVGIKTLEEYGHTITKETKEKVRLVKIKLPSGETEVLITNLLKARKYTIKDLGYLYGLRWSIETCYGKEKNQQQLEQFSGNRVICVEQDYYANVFVANLQSLIEKQSQPYLDAVSRKRKYTYKINCNVSFSIMKNNIFKLFLEEDPQHILLYLQKLFERELEPVRPNRTYPRIKKVRRMNGKYQTLTNYKRTI